jgi:ABC-type polysaccharide/polyol phosphate transport system ATPase subunit
MVHIVLDDVTVEYPIYTSHTRALKTVVISRLGGQLAAHNQTTIVRALSGVNLDLNAGDRLCVVGHNGSGKTTLLRVLSGAYQPQIGEVDIIGTVSSFTDITLGMDPEATGWENIIFRCVFMGMTFAEARGLAPSIAEFTDLGEYLHLPVRTYSSGMFMRLAFAVTTSVTPDIIVMDEMIGTGDAQFIQKAQQRLNELLSNTKILVLATHNQQIGSEFCNKGLWLEKGEVRRFGPAKLVLNEYLSLVEQEEGADLVAIPALIER